MALPYKKQVEFGKANLETDSITPIPVIHKVLQLNDLVDKILVHESKKYASQKVDVFEFSNEEMKAFLGICLIIAKYEVLLVNML